MGKIIIAAVLAVMASTAQAQVRDVPQDQGLHAQTTVGDGYVEDRFGVSPQTVPDARPQIVPPSVMDDGDQPTDEDVRIERRQEAAPPPARYVANSRNLRHGDVVVDPAHHLLYVGVDEARMRIFPVAVGRRGAAWHGVARVGFKTVNPTWHPTRHMQRIKHVASVVRPGPSNPLGVRAIYLFRDGRDTLYRIHGTNQPSSIGKSVSHGCIRMRNSDVVQLYDMVPVGAQVTVL